MEKIFEVRT